MTMEHSCHYLLWLSLMIIGRGDYTDNWTGIRFGIPAILGDIWQGFGSSASANATAAESKTAGIGELDPATEIDGCGTDQGAGQ
jgi:hypothetical protein